MYLHTMSAQNINCPT